MESLENPIKKGTITKYGKEITVREIGPETTLVRLLTHDGQ